MPDHRLRGPDVRHAPLSVVTTSTRLVLCSSTNVFSPAEESVEGEKLDMGFNIPSVRPKVGLSGDCSPLDECADVVMSTVLP